MGDDGGNSGPYLALPPKESAVASSTLDKITSLVGLTLTAMLLIAGMLLTWGHNFVANRVHTQLAAGATRATAN